jgi:hypothetical protein
VGKYEYYPTDRPATLLLRANGTYRFCTTVCADGEYEIQYIDDLSDYVVFYGKEITEFGDGSKGMYQEKLIYSVHGNVDYGFSCPCIVFDILSGAHFSKSLTHNVSVGYHGFAMRRVMS